MKQISCSILRIPSEVRCRSVLFEVLASLPDEGGMAVGAFDLVEKWPSGAIGTFEKHIDQPEQPNIIN